MKPTLSFQKFAILLLVLFITNIKDVYGGDASRPTALAEEWEFVGESINEPGYHIWGCSPIMDEVGRVHLFAARWPVEAKFVPGWYTDSEIAHYVADGPEGPFEFVEVVAQGTDQGWDAKGIHNPNIQKVGNRYALTYIANSGQGRHGPNQRIGILLAESLAGTWKPANGDPQTPLLSPPTDRQLWCYESGCGVTNPALLVQPNGKCLLYFKAKPGMSGQVRMGVAIAEQVEGPYKIQPEPITANDSIIEDGYAFIWRDHVCLMTTDNHGMLERGGGLLWVSKNGTQFDGQPLPGFRHFSRHYLAGKVPEAARDHYGREVKFERPQVLMIAGEPAYLYVPSGTALDGSDGTNGYILRRRGKN